jgi:hypothetical protein
MKKCVNTRPPDYGFAGSGAAAAEAGGACGSRILTG